MTAVPSITPAQHDQGEEGLAFRLGGAIDHLDDHFTLTARDREAVLRVLTECPAGLEDLRATLLADQIGGVRGRRISRVRDSTG